MDLQEFYTTNEIRECYVKLIFLFNYVQFKRRRKKKQKKFKLFSNHSCTDQHQLINFFCENK